MCPWRTKERERVSLSGQDLHRFGITEEEVLEASNTAGLLSHEQKWKDFMATRRSDALRACCEEFQMARCERSGAFKSI